MPRGVFRMRPLLLILKVVILNIETTTVFASHRCERNAAVFAPAPENRRIHFARYLARPVRWYNVCGSPRFAMVERSQMEIV
jgi:hypothetical protein